MIPTSVTGHCTSNSSPNQNKSQHESTLSHVNSESSKYCLLYSTVTCCLIPSLIAWHCQFLTLPLANIPLTVWANIATYCLALSLAKSKLLPDTVISWICHLLPDTVISWIPITARHCHCLTYWHCHFPTSNYYQTVFLHDSVTYCLTLSFPDFQLLPDTVSAWFCHLLLSTVNAPLPITARHCHCLSLPLTVQHQHLLPNISHSTYSTKLYMQFVSLPGILSRIHCQSPRPWYNARHPVPDKLSGMRLTGLCHRQFEWCCLSWRAAGIAESE